ncbi:MAG: DUF4175 family protein [Cytophagales bacterium]|nr:DUF4175 family protein [Bernardetiaceae bacterium]MDW8203777.1 DUF4175 family protein [Cytophagales bacterium]
MMPSSVVYEQIVQKLNAYKRKYYKNILLKGIMLTIGALTASFILVNGIEYVGNFSSWVRAILFFSFLAITAISIYQWIVIPILRLFNLNRPLTNEEAAIQIGKYFPEINDRLLNILQLGKLNTEQTDLIAASIEQKAKTLSPIDFRAAIDYTQNKKYLRYFIPPVLILLLLAALIPQIFTETTPRLIYYSKTFAPKAPFSFQIPESQLIVFKNEDFTLQVRLVGSALPSEAYILYNDRRVKMETLDKPGMFTFTFKNVQKDIPFSIEASGFISKEYLLKLQERPNMSSFTAFLDFPAYLRKANEKLANTGNLIVPQGTIIKWVFNTQQTEQLIVKFQSDTAAQFAKANGNVFEFTKKAMQSGTYTVQLKNRHSTNKDIIEYFLDVIPDEYPSISLNQLKDTALYNFIAIAGNISDDYGISRLELKYRILKKANNADNAYNSIKINFNPNLISQSYYHEFNVDNFGLEQGDKLEYFVQVWDNDGVNGAKSSKTAIQQFSIPDRQEFAKELERAASSAKNQLEKALQKAEELKKSLSELQDRFKGKKRLNWQDKQALEELIKRREELTKEIQELQKQNEIFNRKQERFGERDREIAEKTEQLHALMEELLDEETKKLYDELNKLLQQELQNPNNLQNILEEMEKREKNIVRELDRALEMFKKLQLEQKTKEAISNLQELSKEQKEIAEQTNENALPSEQLKEKQEELNQKFEQQQQQLKQIEQLAKELQKQEQKNLMEELQNDQQQIEQNQKESIRQLEQKQNQKASDLQRNAAQKMQQISQKMQQMQQSAEAKQQVEDYNALRQILENLIKLSFDQENLMLQFKNVRQEDPRFIELGQQQLRIKENAKIVEDSLLALSKRVFQIKSFVTREVSDMNDYINQSLEEIKKRHNNVAAGKQQFAMRSINNLALMLDDVLHQMQQEMGQQMGGLQLVNKKRKDRQQQNLSEMQQSLNQQIQELMKSGKQGKEISEQLAKLAAQQEMIRRALRKATEGKMFDKNGQQKNGKDGSGGDIAKLLEEMEKTEEDLVNRRLTQDLIKRQKEIVTRLLESEKALREREQDEQREAEHAKEKNKTSPGNYENYLKEKAKQIELLKTVPPSLNPYYKQEVNEYFKKINESAPSIND